VKERNIQFLRDRNSEIRKKKFKIPNINIKNSKNSSARKNYQRDEEFLSSFLVSAIAQTKVASLFECETLH
jgi:hypothetical protein